MHTFTDSKGQEWHVPITVGTIAKVKNECGVDLLTIVEGTLLDKLALNPVLIVSSLYCCCEQQVKQRGLSPEEFGETIDSNTIDSALSALLEALIDFFPSAKRNMLRKAMEKLEAANQKAVELMDRPEMDTAITDMMTRAVNEAYAEARTFGKQSGRYPVS